MLLIANGLLLQLKDWDPGSGSRDPAPGAAPTLVWICLPPQAEQGAWAIAGFSTQHRCQSQKQAAMHKEYKAET